MNGLLLIDKPQGWSSFDVVAKVRGVLRKAGAAKPKVGHTGTLDPLATGLMIIVVGSYCKRAQEFSKLDKTYQVTARLGQTSTTGDEEGEKSVISDHQPTLAAIESVLEQFQGTLLQTPPAYSAIKVGGKRAYQLARAGKEVKIEPRQVTIYGYKGIKYTYPKLILTVDVSSGTYIRTLVEDIGGVLKTGAYTTALNRLKVGKFLLTDAQPIANITPETIGKYLRSNV